MTPNATMRTFVLVAMILWLVPARASEGNLSSVDSYLAMWDRFAQGENSFAREINDAWPAARESLIRGLNAKDPSFPSRVVFLMLVQVGGSMDVDSDLGRAWRNYVGDFPVTEDDSRKVYFAADFYSWWRRHQSTRNDLPLLREWLSRDFAMKTVIPMYEGFSKGK
jgi:hypothetical protein